MKIIHSSILPPQGYKAITILNCIFVRKGKTLKQVDIDHEEIHWKQEKELLIVGFYLLYVVFFVFNLIRFCNWSKAYRTIPFEIEAYVYEDCIEERRHFGWAKYI